MESLLRHWKRVPATIRKPIILIVGCIFILTAAATGWLPGPGGIPLFLIGIAILATEFEWAERLRNRILALLGPVGRWFRAHKRLGITILVLLAALTLTISYFLYTR